MRLSEVQVPSLSPEAMKSVVEGLLITNTETIAGKVITQNLGVVGGSTVRAKNIGRDITQGLRNIVGGELVKYKELLEESRTEARSPQD